MIVRYARAGDAGALIPLARATRTAGAVPIPGLSAGSLHALLWAAARRPDQVLVAVAEEDEEPVGFVAAFRQTGAPGDAICDRLHVAHAHADAGFGLAEIALVGALVDWARRQGARRAAIGLDVLGDEPATARRLEELGFRRHGRSLVRDLGPAPAAAPALRLETGVAP